MTKSFSAGRKGKLRRKSEENLNEKQDFSNDQTKKSPKFVKNDQLKHKQKKSESSQIDEKGQKQLQLNGGDENKEKLVLKTRKRKRNHSDKKSESENSRNNAQHTKPEKNKSHAAGKIVEKSKRFSEFRYLSPEIRRGVYLANTTKKHQETVLAITKEALRVEPKKFKEAPLVTTNKPSSGNRQLLVNVLWTFSSALCLFGHEQKPDEEDSQKEIYMEEADEVRKMAKDLAVNKAGFDAGPLVDLLIALSMRKGNHHRYLTNYVMSNFSSLFRTNHVQQIVEALGKTVAQLSGNEGEESEEEEEEEEDFKPISKKELKQLNKRKSVDEPVEEDDDESENDSVEDDDVEEEEEKEDDAGDNKALDPKFVEKVQNALGKAGFEQNQEEVPDEEDNWELTDKQMFDLDTALGAAFRANSTKYQREAEQQSMELFRRRLLLLLQIYISLADYGQALSIYLSTVRVIYSRNRAFADRLHLKEPLTIRKKECQLTTEQLLVHFHELLDPFAADEEEKEEDTKKPDYSYNYRKIRVLIQQACQLLFSLSANFGSNTAPAEIVQLFCSLFVKCMESQQFNAKPMGLIQYVLEKMLVGYTPMFFDQMSSLCLKHAFKAELSFHKKVFALHLAEAMIRKDTMRNITKAKMIAKIFASNLNLLKPNEDEKEESPRKIGKKNVKEKLESPTEKDAKATEEEQQKEEKRLRTLFLAKFIVLLHHFCLLTSPEEKMILRQGLESSGITNLEQSIHDALGDEGLKVLQHKVPANDGKATSKFRPAHHSARILENLVRILSPEEEPEAEEMEQEENTVNEKMLEDKKDVKIEKKKARKRQRKQKMQKKKEEEMNSSNAGMEIDSDEEEEEDDE